ncbi:hypothetical protein J6590_080230 [Homalodisca vitripennis]|nr:hypothetical protein J6590_080230 [Homalodisca vitripennis]
MVRCCFLVKIILNNGTLYLYADDTVALFDGHMWEEVYRNAERGLHTIKQWFDTNRLTVNICKKKHMAVSLRATRDPVGLQLEMHNGQCGGRQIPWTFTNMKQEAGTTIELSITDWRCRNIYLKKLVSN